MTKHKTYNWEALREEFKNSDLSIVDFAKAKGFSANSGRTHLKDIAIKKEQEKQELQHQPNTVHNQNPESENIDFIPLELLDPDPDDLEIPEVTFIRTPTKANEQSDIKEAEISVTKHDIPIDLKINNVSITLHAGFEKSDLRNILEVVRELC